MTFFTTFEAPGEAGFRLIAGREQGLSRLLVASGRIPAGEPGRMHQHAGDEVIRIVSGEVVMRVGDERRTAGAGDVVIVPPNTLHGFVVVSEVVMEVVAEQDIGTFFPVRRPDGTRELVQIFTPAPWNPAPPDGEYMTEEQVDHLARAVDLDV